MEEIKLYIISNDNNKNDENKKKGLKSETNNELEDINNLEDLRYRYRIWLNDLSQFMSSCSYRKVIAEIEISKKNYLSLPKEELFKYKIIELKAILKIIQKKLDKYKVEIKRENSRQNRAIRFWFNQSFYIFEELNNDFNPEKNKKIKISSLDIINPIQKIIGKYLELIHLLITYYKETNEIIIICLYLSFAERFIPFIPYLIDYNSLYIFQQLLLYRAKICLENRDYRKSLFYQQIVVKLCVRIFLIIADVYKGLDTIDVDITQKSSFTEKIYNNFVNLSLCFYLKGVTLEHIGNLIKASKSYIFCKWIYIKFLIDDNELFGLFLSKIENAAMNQIQIINDIREVYNKRKTIKNKRIILTKIKNLNKAQPQRNIDFSFNRRYSLLLKQNHSIQYNKNKNKINKKKSIGNNKEINKTNQLEKYLDKIGEKLYKEEENRNNNLIKNFTKSSYIVSTMTMINNLLSKEFGNILFKMDKIEITKPKDEINNLINKTIIEKRRKMFNYKLAKNRRVNSANNINISLYDLNNKTGHSSLIKDYNSVFKNLKYHKNKRKYYNVNTSNSSINNNNKNNLYNYRYSILENNKLNTNQSSIINNNNKKRKSSFHNLYRNLMNSYKDNSLSCNYVNITNPLEKEGIIKHKRMKMSASVKVIRYPIDRNFSKIQLRKKNYIDKYFDKEIDFHKKLLNSKIYEIRKTADLDNFNPKKEKDKAEREFDLMYNIEKTKYDKKEMSGILNLKKLKILNDLNKNNNKKDSDINEINMEMNLMSSRKKRQRRLGIVEINRKKLIWLNNEGKMKKLSAECEDISNRQRRILSKRRKILFKISNKK